MDWLLEIREQLEKQVFDRASELLGLEVDLLFFDTTSTYFVTETADAPVAATSRENPVPDGAGATAGAGDGFRPGASPRPPRRPAQVVIGWPSPATASRCGLVLAREHRDSALIRQVKDDMRHWTLSRVVWVADRGFTSAENRRYLRKGANHYIIGERLRSGPPRRRRPVTAGPLQRSRRTSASGSADRRGRAARHLPQP